MAALLGDQPVRIDPAGSLLRDRVLYVVVKTARPLVLNGMAQRALSGVTGVGRERVEQA